MEIVVVQIVVARPDDLDRFAVHRLGQHGRLDAVIGLGLAPKSAAEQRDVHGDIFDRHAEPFGDQVACGLRRLEAAPDLALALRDASARRRRFHRRMRKMRKVVFRRDAFRGSGRSGGEVPVVADDLARLARGLLERRLVGNRVVARHSGRRPTRSSAPCALASPPRCCARSRQRRPVD